MQLERARVQTRRATLTQLARARAGILWETPTNRFAKTANRKSNNERRALYLTSGESHLRDGRWETKEPAHWRKRKGRTRSTGATAKSGDNALSARAARPPSESREA